MDIVRQAAPKSKKLAVPLAAGAIVAIGIASVLWRSSAPATPTVEKSAVWTERVKRGELVRQVPAQGTLIPEHVEWLSAVTAARVAKILVRPGAAVEADTVVLVLENSDMELAALEAEQQAASAASALVQLDVRTASEAKLQESTLLALHSDARDAQHHATAAQTLAPQGLMSDLDLTAAMNKAKGLDDQVGSEEARREMLKSGRTKQLAAQRDEVEHLKEIAAFRRKQLADLQIKAGVKGVVQDVPLENGQWVAIGTLLAKVAEPGRLKADVKVAEADARDVHRGLPVHFDASNGGKIEGHVERVDPAVIGGNVRLEVTLDGDLPASARVDQAVNGFVEIERLEGVLFVARPAAAQENAIAGVFRLEPDHEHAARVSARFGKGSAREIEILGGVNEGDEIVVSDTTAWDADDRVRLK